MKLKGITAVRGIVSGEILVIDLGKRRNHYPYSISLKELKEELRRYGDHLKRISFDVGGGSIYSIYEAIINDSKLWEDISSLMEKTGGNALLAFEMAVDTYSKKLNSSGEEKFRSLAEELNLWKNDFLEFVRGRGSSILQESEGRIVIGKALNISDVFRIIKYRARGVVLENGSLTSHPVLMLKSKGIPTLIKVKNAVSVARNYRYALLNATEGFVEFSNEPFDEIDYPEITIPIEPIAKTRDGQRVLFQINLDIPEEMEKIRGFDVGLFRTEYLYLMGIVSSSDQEAVYRQISEMVYPHTVTIRLFDLGGEKIPLGMSIPPYVRGIRYLLEYNRSLLENQIKAINRANERGNIRVLVPMVSTIDEVLEVRKLLRKDIPLGIMIETPASALITDRFRKYVDFFSVGTNDLTQYVMAVDRKVVDHRFHPAIFRLIWYSFDKSDKGNYSVCGDLAANDMGLLALLSIGIRIFSVPPHYLPDAFHLVSKVDRDILQKTFRKLITAYSERDVERILRRTLNEIL